MAAQSIRAIYRDGMMRLLDPVDLQNDQEVSLLVMPSENERARAALADLVIEPTGVTSVNVDLEELMRSIAAAFADLPTLSETIIEERRSGP